MAAPISSCWKAAEGLLEGCWKRWRPDSRATVREWCGGLRHAHGVTGTVRRAAVSHATGGREELSPGNGRSAIFVAAPGSLVGSPGHPINDAHPVPVAPDPFGVEARRPFQEDISMRKITKRSAVIAGITAVALGGGAAWAAIAGWNITGTGTAEATAASITKMSATSKLDKTLYPGLVTTMVTEVANGNEFPVKLTDKISVTPTDVVVTPSDDTAVKCKENLLKTADVIVTDFPGEPTIAAGATKQKIQSSVKIGSLPQDCASKTIKVTYGFSGTQQAAS
ncbi:hypothetical protein AB0F81_46515 [Actinoplanes sp. NPDC024001]|uniref:hypothetical protein n=1 Tax=Actinoplanes sp. NPDC024001 TaxID=3154598 RepID=UPI0033D9489D